MLDSQMLLQLTQSLILKIQDNHFSSWSKQDCDHIYRDLVDIVIGHNILYYQHQQPIISDQEYDYLYDKIKQIEEIFPEMIVPESPTQQITGQIQDEFTKAEHLYPLLSLENSYNTQDVQDRCDSISKIITKSDEILYNYIGEDKTFLLNFICEPKYDGVAIELIYRERILTQAITRGDGIIGEDVTINIATITSIPKTLPPHCPDVISIRGEIVMPKSVFYALNKQKITQGNQIFVNPRNACSGSIKQLDPNITAQRGLICYVYDILNYHDIGLQTQESMYETLAGWGFNIYPRHVICSDLTHVQQIITDSKVKNLLDQADIDFDGIVIKVNQLSLYKILGSTNHHPRRAIAYKFPAKQIHTTLEAVEYQIGRMGTITPVAILQPVTLAGVTISKATLHNFDFIIKKDIRIGDQVVIQRSGEVIPYVVSVVTTVRTGKEQIITTPHLCPVCQTPLLHQDILILCPNNTCKAKIKQQILHFVSRNAMNIEGFGDSIVDMLVESGILNGWIDIYKLSDGHLRSTLKSLPLIGNKKLDQLITNIDTSKQRELWRIIHAIGIPNVGKKTAVMISQAVAEYVHTHGLPLVDVGRVIHIILSSHFLTSIFGLGDKSVQAIQDYLNDPNHISMLMNLQNYGIRFDHLPSPNTLTITDSKLACKHIAISGTFIVPRIQLIDIIIGQGAWYDEQISRKTDILIVGVKGGSKIAKAQQRGIVIVEGIDGLLNLYPDLEIFLGMYREKSEVGLFV